MAEQTYALSQSGVYGLANGAYADALSAIPDSGVARWRFEQNVLDSWNNNDGTDNTSAGYTTDSKEGDYAKQYDGADDNVSVASNSRLQLQQGFSVGGYVRFSSTSGTQTIIGSRGATSNGYQLRWQKNTDEWNWLVSDGGTLDQYKQSATPATGTWYHVVGVVEGDGTIQLYVNATEGGTPTGDGVVSSPSTRSTERALGRNGDDNSEYWDGDQDDIRVYDKGLTATEVSNWYNTGSISG